MARAGADQRDEARAVCGRVGRRRDPRAHLRLLRRPRPQPLRGHRLGEEAVEKRLAPLGRDTAFAHHLAEARRRRRPRRPAGVEPALEQLAQPPHDERRATTGADCELQRAPLDARRQVEGAQLGVVGDVDPEARSVGVVAHAAVHLAVVGGGEHQAVAARFALLVRALAPDQATLGDEPRERRHDRGGDDRDVGCFLQQALGLAQRDLAAADDEAAYPREAQCHRIHRDPPHPTCRRACRTALRIRHSFTSS